MAASLRLFAMYMCCHFQNGAHMTVLATAAFAIVKLVDAEFPGNALLRIK